MPPHLYRRIICCLVKVSKLFVSVNTVVIFSFQFTYTFRLIISW